MGISNLIILILVIVFNVTRLTSIVIPPNSNSNINYDQDIEKLHQQVQSLIDQSQFNKAEAILDSLIATNPKSYLANYQLGLIYSRKKNCHEQAEVYFQKSIELNRKNPSAYYELGMLYKNGPFPKDNAIRMFTSAIRCYKEFKDAHYQRAMTIMQYNGYVPGLKKLEKLVVLDPDFKDCYQIYIKIGFAFHQFDRMEKFLPKLVQSFPDRPQFQLDMIHVLYRNRKYEIGLQQLQHLKQSYPDFSLALQNFCEARIRFARGEDGLASELYWNSIDHISKESEANEIFTDIIFLVTNEEYEEYVSSSMVQKKSFFYRFWKSRDLTLTTSFNERLPEHYQRLRYAQKQCRRYPDKEFLNFFFEDFAEPLHRIMAPDIVRFGTTKGSKNQQQIDDLGIIYIRHGKPDAFATYIPEGGGIIKTNVSWCYFAQKDMPKMIFHFIFEEADGYRLEVYPTYPQERWTLDARYLSSFKTGQLAFENMETIARGTATETSNFEPELKPFEIPFSCYSFKGEGKKEAVYLCYQFPREALPEVENENSCQLHQQIILFNGDWEEVDRFDTTASFDAPESIVTKVPMHKYRWSLTSGHYFLGMKMTNMQSKREGHLRFGFQVPSSYGAELKLSVIILGNSSDNSVAVLNQKLGQSAAPMLAPLIDRQFRIDEPILAYFEIYNLELDHDGETKYSIQFKISQREKHRSTIQSVFSRMKAIFKTEKFAEMTIADEFSGNSHDEFISRSFLLAEATPGLYEISIDVVDDNAKTQITRRIDFVIKD